MSNKKQSRCLQPDLCLGAEDQEWTPERARSSVTTEGASSWTPPSQPRAPEGRQCLWKTCGTERSKSQQPPVCPLPKPGPRAKQSWPFVVFWGSSVKFPGCEASSTAATCCPSKPAPSFISLVRINCVCLGLTSGHLVAAGNSALGVGDLLCVPQEPMDPIYHFSGFKGG